MISTVIIFPDYTKIEAANLSMVDTHAKGSIVPIDYANTERGVLGHGKDQVSFKSTPVL